MITIRVCDNGRMKRKFLLEVSESIIQVTFHMIAKASINDHNLFFGTHLRNRENTPIPLFHIKKNHFENTFFLIVDFLMTKFSFPHVTSDHFVLRSLPIRSQSPHSNSFVFSLEILRIVQIHHWTLCIRNHGHNVPPCSPVSDDRNRHGVSLVKAQEFVNSSPSLKTLTDMRLISAISLATYR